MTFQDDLQRAGLDPAAIAGRRVRPMADNVRAFLRGTVDVIQVFEPHADRLASEGRGHVWHRFSERGDVCYTTFMRRGGSPTRAEACRRLVRHGARAGKRSSPRRRARSPMPPRRSSDSRAKR
jgi:ABC-type nitrate/sulfonate/bicarbonate transport system substrate-binding protein